MQHSQLVTIEPAVGDGLLLDLPQAHHDLSPLKLPRGQKVKGSVVRERNMIDEEAAAYLMMALPCNS